MKFASLLLLAMLLAYCCSSQVVLKDRFGRNLTGQNIILTDWDGYMANPAILLTVKATGVSFPFTVNLSANGARLYFDLPCMVGGTGPTKSIILNDTSTVSFYISIFPDRDSISENYTLVINSSLGTQNYAIRVIDQDVTDPTPYLNIVTDFSKDTVYHFYNNQSYKNIARQAANDWAFFFENMNFDTVPANSEYTYIQNDDYIGGYLVTNTSAYSGFLLYLYGIHTTGHHSSAGASTYGLQTVAGVTTQLLRSGTYETEVHGNFNSLGWDTTITDNTWYLGTNYSDIANDFYSVSLHEMGHSLGFFTGYPVFGNYENNGYVDDTAVVNYQGSQVPVDNNDHLANGQTEDSLKVVDRISKRGAFGSEYGGAFPYGRPLITKVNLLCLQAVGYRLRNTSAFKLVSITTSSPLAAFTVGQAYNSNIVATGGIPFYKFEILTGTLPTGLGLNSFTGVISGTPTLAGNYSFVVQVTDYDKKTFSKSFSLSNAVTYTFTGNGNWSDPNNWANHVVPPSTLTGGMEVIINHSVGGQCIYTGNLNLLIGGKVTVMSGKKLTIKP